MNILGSFFLLDATDGIIVGGDANSIKTGSSDANANTAAPVQTGTSTGTPDAGATDTPAQDTSPWTIILIYGAMLVAMYFFLFRPQRKQAKAMKQLQETLKTGENVVTSNGMYGKIVGVGQDCFLVEFGENRGVRIWVRKNDIVGISAPVTTMSVESIEEKKK